MEELEDQSRAETTIAELAALALSQASTIEIQEEELESQRRLLHELGRLPCPPVDLQSNAARLLGNDDDDRFGEDCINVNDWADRGDSGNVDVWGDREEATNEGDGDLDEESSLSLTSQS